MVDNSNTMRAIPPGILIFRRFRGQNWSLSTYRYVILLVTFIAYTCYHASRKPTSIVKSVLYPDPNKDNGFVHPWPIGNVFVKQKFVGNEKYGREKGWAPFNDADGRSKLGEIDVAFLSCYAFGMYIAGHLGDSLDLRLFLSFGMIGSGFFVGLFGMGYFWDVHAFGYFLVMQMVAGLFQATGWPSVVAVIGNWFGKTKRGLIMGVWNAHTSVGNISGSLLAACVLDYGWGWSFILPATLIVLGGVMVCLFLAAYPEDIEFSSPHVSTSSLEDVSRDMEIGVETSMEMEGQIKPFTQRGSVNRKSVGLLEACAIPGVIPFALCLFFSKLVAYTFLYWLPFYLSETEIGGEYLSVKSSGNLSTLFDVGGIFGGILAGYISDRLHARATTAATFMYAAIPSMFLYRTYGHTSQTINIVLMMIAGLFVNGPYALITTAVSADLGTHSSLKGDSRALATVTAIIDGTGSVGASLGPLVTGFLSTQGWDKVFVMLMCGALIAGLLLSRLVVAEISERTCKQATVSCRQGTDGVAASQPLLGDQR